MDEANATQASQQRMCFSPDTLAPPTGAPATPFYSWAVKRGPLVFLSGMSPYSLEKQLVGTTIGEQARQAFRNMEAAMVSVGGSIGDVCSITVYVQETDLQKHVYPEINPVCHEVFGNAPPARAVMGGIALPRPTELVMITGIAILGQ